MAARRAPHMRGGDPPSTDEAGQPRQVAGAVGEHAPRHDRSPTQDQAPPDASACPAPASTAKGEASLAVVDIWPSSVPITNREVEAVEAFLGRFLNEILVDDPQDQLPSEGSREP